MIDRNLIQQVVTQAEADGYRPVMVTTAQDVVEIGVKSPLGDTFEALARQPYGVVLFRAEDGDIYEVSFDGNSVSDSRV